MPSCSKKDKRPLELSDSEEGDADFVRQKKKGKSVQVQEIKAEVVELGRQISSIFQLSQYTRLPPGLIRLLHDAFRCSICQSVPIKSPIFSRCCKNIIGCQECVDQWYGNDVNNTCPICRSERAYAETSQIKGLDEFLDGVRPLLDNEGSSD